MTPDHQPSANPAAADTIDSTAGQTTGPLVMDAHSIALDTEHGCALAITDRDFARFPSPRITNPLAPQQLLTGGARNKELSLETTDTVAAKLWLLNCGS